MQKRSFKVSYRPSWDLGVVRGNMNKEELDDFLAKYNNEPDYRELAIVKERE